MAPRSPSSSHKRPVFGPQCTHLTMTRLYSPDLRCGNCHSPGPFGWLYQCTQDRDDSIEQAVSRGDFANMDDISCLLTLKLRVRQGSPASREDTLSFFKELTQERLASYQPDQVATILRQRENVQLVIQREKMRRNGPAILNHLTQPNAADSTPCQYSLQKPWVCSPHEECHYRICFRCRPACSDRAFLSLNAVAKGDISPTAAAGYGFHILGERPVMDAKVVKNLACRPVVPMPQSTSTSDHDSPASTSTTHVIELLDAQIARGRMLWARQQQKEDPEIQTAEDSDDDFTLPLTPTTPNSTPGQLKHSPGCENLGLYANTTPLSCPGSVAPLLWTPPPSPLVANLHERDGATERYDGATPLKAAPPAKDNGASHFPPGSTSTMVRQGSQSHSRGHLRGPSLDETPTEMAVHKALPTSPTSPAKRDKKFTPSPLKVGHGVAMLEESVELGFPDVITHA